MKIKSLITSAALALASASVTNAVTFSFSGNSDGTIGNVRTFTSSDNLVLVQVSAFAYYNSTISQRAVGVYSGGLGVNNANQSPSDIGTPSHTVDNQNGVDMLLFKFFQNNGGSPGAALSLNLSKISTGYVSGDSDFKYATGAASATASSLYGTGNAIDGGANPASYNINASGSSLLIYADPNGYVAGTSSYFNYQTWSWVPATTGNPYDYFKIDGLTFTVPSGGGNVPDSGSTVTFMGIAILGLAALKRRMR